METENACKCCCEVVEVTEMCLKLKINKKLDFKCITLHPGFDPICINEFALENSYKRYKKRFGETISDANE